MFFKKPMMRHVKDVRTGQSLFCKKPPKFTTATFASLLFRLSLKRKVCRRSLRLSLAPGSIRIFLASYCSSNLLIKVVCHKVNGASTNKKLSNGCWEIRNQPTILFSDDHIHLLGSRAEHRNTNFRNYNAR